MVACGHAGSYAMGWGTELGQKHSADMQLANDIAVGLMLIGAYFYIVWSVGQLTATPKRFARNRRD